MNFKKIRVVLLAEFYVKQKKSESAKTHFFKV